MKIVFNQENEPMKEDVHRIAHIVPDKSRVYKYDKFLTKGRRNTVTSNIYTFILVGITIFLIIKGVAFIWIALFCLFTLLSFLFSMPKADNRLKVVYEESSLYPAVVIELKPIKLLVMARVTNEEKNIVWGVTTVIANGLPIDNLEIGTRIPCCVLYGLRQDEKTKFCNDIEVHPICWATGDKLVLNNAISRIDIQEWNFLEKLINKVWIDGEFAYFSSDFTMI